MKDGSFNKILVSGIILVFIAAGIVPQAGAKNLEARNLGSILYVDDDALCPGNGTLQSPYCKIQYALDNASEDDTIMVANGTYHENIIISTTGLHLEWLGTDIIGDDIDQPVVDGDELSDVVKIFADNVEISEFTIQKSGDLDFGVNVLGESITILNCDIIDNYYGINLPRPICNLCTIDGCIISNNVLSGIVLYDRSHDNTIINCQITGNKWGVSVKDSYNNIIQENFFSGNTVGLVLQGASTYGNDVFRCVFEENEIGIWIFGGSNRNFIHYNDFINTTKKYNPFSYLRGFPGTKGAWCMHAVFSMCVAQEWDHNYWSPKPFFEGTTQPYVIWGTMYPTWISIFLPGAWRPQLIWANIDMNCRANPLNS
jgi:parallel beta-helix repeat protein